MVCRYVVKMKKKISITLCCSTQLQQPYIESDEDILGHFLFNTEDIEEKKELLFAIWKRRQHQMKII